MDTEVYKREDAPAIWEALMTKVQRIEHSLEKDQWPAKPSGLCPWCPLAQSQCEFR